MQPYIIRQFLYFLLNIALEKKCYFYVFEASQKAMNEVVWKIEISIFFLQNIIPFTLFFKISFKDFFKETLKTFAFFYSFKIDLVK